MEAHEAVLNVTWAGQNGELPDPVPYDAADGDLKQMAAEAIRGGDIPGIAADPGVNLADFIVDRFGPVAGEIEHHRLILRPKTPFGGEVVDDRVKALVADVQTRLPPDKKAYFYGEEKDGTVLVGIRKKYPRKLKLSLNMLEQLKWMLERDEGKDRDYCGAGDFNGDIWEASIENGQMVLKSWEETRDTRKGTIEYWNRLEPSDAEGAPLGADGKPITFGG